MNKGIFTERPPSPSKKTKHSPKRANPTSPIKTRTRGHTLADKKEQSHIITMAIKIQRAPTPSTKHTL